MAPKTPKKTLDLHGHATELLREAASSGAWLALMNMCWVTFQVELLKHRSAIRQRIEKSGGITAYDYWGKSGNQLGLLQLLLYYRYTNAKFNVTKAAELINTTRQWVSGALKEARGLGLVDDNNRPTEATESVTCELTYYLLHNDGLINAIHHMSARANIFALEDVDSKMKPFKTNDTNLLLKNDS